MTEIERVHKMDTTNHIEERRTFLRSLYAGAPDDLYFELRCIHPETGNAKTFWSRIGDKRALGAAFQRAKALNEEGYGIYFAPCLRSEKKGSTEAATLLPALWIDIDCVGDEKQRVAALEHLHAFDAQPSAIIDSGGGLHAYWLLDQPTVLDEKSRKQVAGIFHGLFNALGGDPGYVKSVASVMRLLGSVNTKEERGGVVATIFELHPDRRYPMSDFAWLEKELQVERIGNMKVITLNGSGHYPLPRRTEDYLAAGATEGNRNTELFGAACQLRDAGNSQSDAEAQLVPRYVADGCSEQEAIRTIRSAYSRPPREPIRDAREQVAQIVQQYGRKGEAQERPTSAQLGETVRACASLDPVAWAEVRYQLKSVCGEGVRIADLDRQYREARRDRERAESPQMESAERYIERDGGMVHERETERGVSRQAVADWTGRVLEWMVQVDDDGQVER